MMNCPPEVAETILDIISRGILRARAAGWEGKADQSAIEADHIHNLPDLLARFSLEKLKSYWEAEVVSFLQEAVAAGLSISEFEAYWERLRSHMDKLTEPQLAK